MHKWKWLGGGGQWSYPTIKADHSQPKWFRSNIVKEGATHGLPSALMSKSVEEKAHSYTELCIIIGVIESVWATLVCQSFLGGRLRLFAGGWGKPQGGTRIIFWRSVRPEVWNPYPYLRIFLPQKMADLKLFFEIFTNRDPFLRVFLPQNGWFYHFFAIFAKWDPLLRIFLTKMGPMSKDFCWKSNPFGRHIPVCLNMWVPPPPPGREAKWPNGLKMAWFTFFSAAFSHQSSPTLYWASLCTE